jgi:phosphate-selective porin
MQRATLFRTTAAIATGLAVPGLATAGITVYEEGSRFLKVGGRVQVQYNYNDPDNGSSTDDFDIRRAWLTFDGSVSEDWEARLQFQLDGGYSTKDAKIQYTGWEFATVTAGNFYVPFSREELTSSKRQQLIEKTPVAGTGSPARQIGVSLSGGSQAYNWEAGLWEAGVDNDPSTLSFGSQIDGDQAYEGQLVGARVEIHPGGDIGYGQGNLDDTAGWEVGINGFAWSNDDDRRPGVGNDYDSINGFGIDGAWRHGGWSVDAEANVFSAETRSASITQGIVENGDADVQTTSVEGGYMIVPRTWEVVAGFGTEEADAWNETETQAGIGVNRFFSGHNNKLQVTVIQTADSNGVNGADVTDLYVQLQHAF